MNRTYFTHNVSENMHIFGELSYRIIDAAEELFSSEEIAQVNAACTADTAGDWADRVEARALELLNGIFA